MTHTIFFFGIKHLFMTQNIRGEEEQDLPSSHGDPCLEYIVFLESI